MHFSQLTFDSSNQTPRTLVICPIKEPSRSGVGDYSLKLASSLQMSGAPAKVVSLCEGDVSGPALDDAAISGDLLLRASESWESRMKQLQQYVASLRPAVVSLQFVTYGYHPKGLPFLLARRLARACQGVRFEIMFHEIWSGGRGARLRNQIYGLIQRRIIRDLVRQLRPVAIHTHATPYLEALRQEGWNPLQLPLFANIPVTEPWSRQTFDRWLESRSGFRGGASREIFCLFGSLYPQWQPGTLLPVLREHLAQSGCKGLILSIGHRGAAGDGVWDQVVRQSDDQLPCLDLGPLPEAEISQCLHASAYGISTTPPDLIEKSGAAAAMFEHGLPVLASRPPVFGDAMAERVGKAVPLIIQGADLHRLASFKKTPPDSECLTRVASQFLHDMRFENPCSAL